MGHYRKRRQDTVTFSSDIPSLLTGERPSKIQEVCISSSLYQKLNREPVLYAGGLVSSYAEGETLFQEYRTAKLFVTGIVEENYDVIYGLPRWCIDYWRDNFGMSSFLLEPKKAIFYLSEKERLPVLKQLQKQYPSYRFTDPSRLAEESIASVLQYVNVALEAASLLALGTAGFLLLVTTILLTFEHKKQGKMLFELGVARPFIADFYGASLLLLTFVATAFSVMTLGGVEILGCGMVDPNVLDACGIDSKVYSGYAFGMGVERITNLKYQVADLRMFSENDVRFLREFEAAE